MENGSPATRGVVVKYILALMLLKVWLGVGLNMRAGEGGG
jgi:hypothetical protein